MELEQRLEKVPVDHLSVAVLKRSTMELEPGAILAHRRPHQLQY